MSEEADQLRGVELAPVRFRLADRRRNERRWRAALGICDLACRAIFRRVAEEFVVALEIIRAEGLQPMSPDQRHGIRDGEIAFCIIEQLAHEHARRERAVVAARSADIAEVENVARGKERLEKEVAIVVARVRSPGAGLAPIRSKPGGRSWRG